MAAYEVRRVAGDGDLSDAHAVRRAVFIDEQDVPAEIEMDGKDGGATHFVASDVSAGTPVGVARVRFPDADTAKAERVAVLPAHREEGLGTRLMDHLEAEARDSDCSRVKLNAQTDVEGFYRNLGYETVSDEVFYEADIPHVRMVKELGDR